MNRNDLYGYFDQYGHLVILGGLIAVFALGFLPSTVVWIGIKLVIFLAVLVLAYQYFAGVQEEQNGEVEEPERSPDAQPWLNLESEEDIEHHFEAFLKTLLQTIKQNLVAETAILLFANYQKKQFTVRAVETDHQPHLVPAKFHPPMEGLPALILRNRTSLIENHLPEAQSILPYYRAGENPAASFLGVPVSFDGMPIGVLCVDTRVEEAYGNEDLEILQKFAELLRLQLLSSNKLYEYETENWIAKLLFEISGEFLKFQNEEELWNYLKKKIPKVIECQRFSIALRENERQGKIVCLDGGIGNLRAGLEFPLTEGIAGWVMRNNQSLLVEDFSRKENYVPRYFAQETPNREYLSLLAVPIPSRSGAQGSICLESVQRKQFNEQHKRILQTVANQVAVVLHNLHNLKILAKHNYDDLETGLLNYAAFLKFVPRELNRAKLLGLKTALVVLKLSFRLADNQEQLFPEVVKSFLSLLLPELPKTFYIFRLFSDVFAILVVGQDRVVLKEFPNRYLKQIREKKIWGDGQVHDLQIFVGGVSEEKLSASPGELQRQVTDLLEQLTAAQPYQTVIFE